MTSFFGVSTLMTLNNLNLPSKEFLVNFSRYPAATHILRVNCTGTEMAKDGLGQPAY